MQNIVLSERNLLSLLHKLYFPGSEATILKSTAMGRVAISAVADDVAYRDCEPGPMHPDTERFIDDMKGVLTQRARRVQAEGRARRPGCNGQCGNPNCQQ